MTQSIHENDIKNITALVYNNDEPVGSAFFIYSEDGSKLYFITAYHCLGNKNQNNEFDSFYIKFDNNKIENYKCLVLDEYNDLAIFSIDDDIPVPNIVPIYPNEQLSYKMIGYPRCVSGNIHNFQVLQLSLSKHEPNYKISFNVKDIGEFDKIEKLEGFSGGPIIGTYLGYAYLIGIETEAINTDVDFNIIYCRSIDIINNLLDNNGLPLLKQKINFYEIYAERKYKLLSEIMKKQSFKNKWIDCKNYFAIKELIIDYMENQNNQNALYICGPSGIGKTRSVLHACEELFTNNTLYFENYSCFQNNKLLFNKYSSNILIIIDEVSMDDWQNINEDLTYMSPIKIVVIGTVMKREYKNIPSIGYIKEMSEPEIFSIIRANYTSFTDNDIKSIFKLSRSDIRLAILISEIFEKSELLLEAHSSRKIINAYNTAEKILKKYFNLFSYSQNDLESIYKTYWILSTLVDVGYKNQKSIELKNLAAFFDKQEKEMQKDIFKLEEANLGIIKEDYFEDSPRELAKLAFEENAWPIIKSDLNEFMQLLVSEPMMKRFYERVYECSLGYDVKEAFASWFLKKYEQCDINVISYNNCLEISFFIEYNPKVGLDWLEGIIIQNQGRLTEFKGKPRQTIVWICEKLANFYEYFFTCENIMYCLAKHETDNVFSNNSQGIWSGLFATFGSNTCISFEERFKLLIKHFLENPDINLTTMYKKALEICLSDSRTSVVPPRYIGGRITPQNSDPKTYNELYEMYDFALSSLCDNYNTFISNIQDIIVDVLINSIRTFLNKKLIIKYKNNISKIALSQGQKNHLTQKIEFFIDIAVGNDKDELIIILDHWLKELKDTTLQGQLYEFTHRSIWSYGYTDEKIQKREQIAKTIARDVCLDGVDLIKELCNDTTCDGEALKFFSQFLAEYDNEYTIFNYLKKSSLNKQVEIMFEGYYAGVFDLNNQLPDLFIDTLIELYEKEALVSIRLILYYYTTINGFEMIMKKINDKGDCANDLKILGGKRWLQLLDVSQRLELLNNINQNITNGHNICWIILYQWNKSQKINDEEINFVFSLLQNCFDKNLNIDIHFVIDILNSIPSERFLQSAYIIIKFFNFNDIYSGVNNYISKYIFNNMTKDNEYEIMEMFGERLISSHNNFLGPASNGFFDHFNIDTIIKWIEKDPSKRAQMIAYHLLSPNLNNKKCSELTVSILSKYPTDEVKNAFINGEENLKVIYVEEYYKHSVQWLELYANYENSSISILQQWANHKKKWIKDLCKSHEITLAEEKRLSADW